MSYLLRRGLVAASTSRSLRRIATTSGPPRRVAMRYVAGETLDDGLRVVRELADAGKTATLDYLGEAVTAEAEARAASKVVLEALDRIGEGGFDAGVSVKPTQMGLLLAPELAAELLDEIATACDRVGVHLTLDMEDRHVTEATVALVEHLKAAGHADVGCAVQSYLRRTFADVQRLTAAGASLRLCKGAYAEPEDVAFSSAADIDANYAACADWLLAKGVYPRLATHDERLIARALTTARRLGLRDGAFELQMLHGVRPSLQDRLVAQGHRLRVYVPFGDQWYPYFMRRLAERPANLLFFLRSLRDT